jgi:hypothetical protein
MNVEDVCVFVAYSRLSNFSAILLLALFVNILKYNAECVEDISLLTEHEVYWVDRYVYNDVSVV